MRFRRLTRTELKNGGANTAVSGVVTEYPQAPVRDAEPT
jgi:hypothetical protein